MARRDKLWADCDLFELPQPDFPQLGEMLEDLKAYEANYLFYEEFSTGLQKLADEVAIFSFFEFIIAFNFFLLYFFILFNYYIQIYKYFF